MGTSQTRPHLFTHLSSITMRDMVNQFDNLKEGKLPEAVARRLVRELGFEWFSCTTDHWLHNLRGICCLRSDLAALGNSDMQKILWYLVVNHHAVGSYIDGYDVSGPADKFMATVDRELYVFSYFNKV